MDTERGSAGKIATQHRLIETLFSSLESALSDRDLERARGRCGGLRRALDAHFLLEEEHYFPRLRRAQPDLGRDLERLAEEHGALRDCAERVSAHLDAPDWDEAVNAQRRLLALFESHESDERRLVGG